MRTIFPNLHKKHDEAVNKALDYIIDVTKKQGRMLPVDTLFGDGSRWLPLSKNGFIGLYDSVKLTLKEGGYNV